MLRGVDLKLARGESVTLFGPNGAGKTTLLRIVATLSQPDNGHIRVGGLSLATHAQAVRGMLGVVSHNPLLYGELTADENLRFYARLYGINDADACVGDALSQVGLEERRRDLVRTFSRGMKQRLAIGRAILHQPRVMLFDEPHTGLDQDAAAMFDEVLHSVACGDRTVLLVTHDLNRGLALADRVAILSRGRIAHEGCSGDIPPAEFAVLYNRVIHGHNY